MTYYRSIKACDYHVLFTIIVHLAAFKKGENLWSIVNLSKLTISDRKESFSLLHGVVNNLCWQALVLAWQPQYYTRVILIWNVLLIKKLVNAYVYFVEERNCKTIEMYAGMKIQQSCIYTLTFFSRSWEVEKKFFWFFFLVLSSVA